MWIFFIRSADVKRWHINFGVMWDFLVAEASSNSGGASSAPSSSGLVWSPRSCRGCGNPFCGLDVPRPQLVALTNSLKILRDMGNPLALRFIETADRSLAPQVIELIRILQVSEIDRP